MDKEGEVDQVFGPLPEGSPDPVLARMLELAPYQAPSREDKGRNKEAEIELHSLFIQTRGISASVKEDNRGGESKIPSPHGKERAASEDLETEVCKRGKKPSPGGPALEGVLTAQRSQGGQPSTELEVKKGTLVNISCFVSENNN